MSRPPLNPEKTPAGIALDPQTLERVIPESKRSDGSTRKQLKIRPGFTPQEDVRRFRGTRQAQMDVNQLPKGHIMGWTPPAAAKEDTKPMSKSAKKNAKRREKKKETQDEEVPDNWDDDEEDTGSVTPALAPAPASTTKPSSGANTDSKEDEALANSLDKLKV